MYRAVWMGLKLSVAFFFLRFLFLRCYCLNGTLFPPPSYFVSAGVQGFGSPEYPSSDLDIQPGLVCLVWFGYDYYYYYFFRPAAFKLTVC